MTTREPTAARAQLDALAADPARYEPWPGALGVPVDATMRAAAVLMLFGVLDGRPSDHDAQASAVPSDLDVLLLARAETLRSHAGQVAFPGGRLDPGDSGAAAAALREAHEETGVDPSGVEVLGELLPFAVPISGHVVTPVLAWWRRSSPVRVVDVAESAHVFRAPVADLLDPGNRRTTVIRRDGNEWRSPAFLVTVDGVEHLVWGITAGLLNSLFDLLGWAEPWDRDRTLELP